MAIKVVENERTSSDSITSTETIFFYLHLNITMHFFGGETAISGRSLRGGHRGRISVHFMRFISYIERGHDVVGESTKKTGGIRELISYNTSLGVRIKCYQAVLVHPKTAWFGECFFSYELYMGKIRDALNKFVAETQRK